MPCRSTILPLPGKDKGWTCTGENLVVLMTTRIHGREVPVVCPRERLADVMRSPWADLYKPRSYIVEGDHLHLELNDLPRRKSWLSRLADFVPRWRR